MSVSLYCYLEVKDKEGKWHLVKTFGKRKFDNNPSEQDEIVSANGEEYVITNEWCPGLAWRDELYRNNLGAHGLPDDVSDELKEYLEIQRLKDFENWKKSKAEGRAYGEEDWYSPESYYRRKYSYVLLEEMFDVCDEKERDWRKYTIKRANELKNDEFGTKLDWIIKQLSEPEKKQKPFNGEKVDEDYQDTFEYLLDEYLWSEVVSLYRETWMLRNTACVYTGNDWFPATDVRVIYYTY